MIQRRTYFTKEVCGRHPVFPTVEFFVSVISILLLFSSSWRAVGIAILLPCLLSVGLGVTPYVRNGLIERKLAEIVANPQHYYKLEFPVMSEIMLDHKDLYDGMVHSFVLDSDYLPFETHHYIEFDNEHDRVMFRLSL